MRIGGQRFFISKVAEYRFVPDTSLTPIDSDVELTPPMIFISTVGMRCVHVSTAIGTAPTRLDCNDEFWTSQPEKIVPRIMQKKLQLGKVNIRRGTPTS